MCQTYNIEEPHWTRTLKLVNYFLGSYLVLLCMKHFQMSKGQTSSHQYTDRSRNDQVP